MIPIPPALFRSLQGLDSELLERIKTAYQQEKDQYLTAVAAELEVVRKRPDGPELERLRRQIFDLECKVEQLQSKLSLEEGKVVNLMDCLLDTRDMAQRQLEWFHAHPFRNLWEWLLRRKP